MNLLNYSGDFLLKVVDSKRKHHIKEGKIMKMPKPMDTSVLVLGDESDWDSYQKFCRQLQKHRPGKLNWVTATYGLLEKNRLPLFKSSTIIIYLFFPFAYWDKHIENEGYKGVYGNAEFYDKFRVFWSNIHRTLEKVYEGKKIYFINHPLKVAIDRDKEVTKTILSENGVNVPMSYYTRNHRDILKLINREGKKLFLKVRYGSMGKGITYLEKGNWQTNFRFEDGKIISPHSDYGWTFIDITDNIKILKEILTKDIVIEEAIDSYKLDGFIFDLRIHVFYEQVLYVYLRRNEEDAIITNISQGGRAGSSSLLKKLPKHVINSAVRNAVKTIKSVGVNFAGVDVMVSKDFKVYVIELNAFPGFPKVGRFNLSKRIIQQVEDKKWGIKNEIN